MKWPRFQVVPRDPPLFPMSIEIHDLEDFDFDPMDETSDGAVFRVDLMTSLLESEAPEMTDSDHIAFVVVVPGTTTALATGIIYNLEISGASEEMVDEVLTQVVDLRCDYYCHELAPGVAQVIDANIDGFIIQAVEVEGESWPSLRMRPRPQ